MIRTEFACIVEKFLKPKQETEVENIVVISVWKMVQNDCYMNLNCLTPSWVSL